MTLALGEGLRLGGVVAGSRVAAISTALPQEEQKREEPDTSLPQAGQFMIGAEYITAYCKGRIPLSDYSRARQPRIFCDSQLTHRVRRHRKVAGLQGKCRNRRALWQPLRESRPD
jgi:hypothetical protein